MVLLEEINDDGAVNLEGLALLNALRSFKPCPEGIGELEVRVTGIFIFTSTNDPRVNKVSAIH
jgi:hypothetical protein